MIKIVNDRAAVKSASLSYLLAHIKYLSDSDHPDHKDKIEIHSHKIYNVPCSTTGGFLAAVLNTEEAYVGYREGKRGKRTNSVWDESIYRTPDNTDLNERELIEVEREMLSIRPKGTPAFTQWHYNKIRASWDLHVLCPTKSSDWPPRVILSDRYGAGKENIYPALDRLDQDLVDLLNLHRASDKRIKSKLERKKEKALAALGEKKALAKEIARLTKGSITRGNLVDLIQEAGHQVPRPPQSESARTISVIFSGRKQPRRYDIAELLDEANAPKKADHKAPRSPEMDQLE